MFNVGGPEVLVILLLALIVLGPQRLPDAAKQVGKVMGELRRMSSGFQQELRSALDDPTATSSSTYAPAKPDAPAVAPVAPTEEMPTATTNGAAPAKKAAAKKRAAPLRAPGKPGRTPAP